MSAKHTIRKWLETLEFQLDDLIRTKSPVQLPDNARQTIATNLWWIALVLGILQFCSAWLLWRAAERVERLVDYANSITLYDAQAPIAHLGLFFYMSVIILAIDGLLLIAAYQGLQKFKKQGWNLLFYGMLLNVAASVIMLFSEHGVGPGDFIRGLFFSIIGAFFLFQVREYFTGIHMGGEVLKVEKTQEKTVK